MAETVRGGILSIDPGQTEGAKAIGMTHFQTMLYVIFPQTLRNIIPQIGNNLIINIKDSSVLSVIGVIELYYAAKQTAGAYYWWFEAMTVAMVLYLIMTFVFSRLLRFWESKLDGPASFDLAEDGDVTQASVSSAFAAKCFGLKVLKENIYSNKANSTRFIIVTNQRIYQKDAKKISICFETPHTSGSLYNILSHFIYNNLNMFGIQSRPIPGRNWEYRFFIDFEGNLNDSAVKNALRGIREEATNMKILGNY